MSDRDWQLLKAKQAVTRDEEWGTLTWFAGAVVGNAHGLTLGRVTIKAGKANPRHYHTTFEEALTLLTGRIEHTMGDARAIMEPGVTLVVPAGIPHNATCLADADAEMMVAYSSADRDFHLE